MIEDISVIIGTCDAYAHLWKNFDILFKRYWMLNTQNLVACETIGIPYNGYINVLPGKISWGSRILKTLEAVKTNYVFFILEDYYLTELITETIIKNHLGILKNHNASKIMLDIINYPEYRLTEISSNLYKFNQDSMYLNSVQPAIWEVDYLKQVIRPEYSPWDFELIGNTYAATLNKTLLIQAREFPIYFNYARVGGRISDGWENVFKKEQLTT